MQRGINLVTLCLSLAFLTGASNFASNHGVVIDLAALNRYVEGLGDKFWLTQSYKFLSDDLFVVPGPVNIKELSRHALSVQYKARPVNVKCHSSRPLVHGDTMDDLTIEPSTQVYVTVAIFNRSNTVQSLLSGIIGDINVPDNDNDSKFRAAATDTAEQVADNITFLSTQVAFYQKATTVSRTAPLVKPRHTLRSYLTQDANAEMARLMSDRGKEFLNTIITELTELLSIKKVYTSAYRPLANGATERVHCFSNDSIFMYVAKFAREWDLWHHATTFVHNTSVIAGTDSLSPFYIVYVWTTCCYAQ